MTTISPIDVRNSGANYNAVKIQVNDPKTSIPEGFKSSEENTGLFNAINIEVNRPVVEVKKDTTYDYSKADEIVTFNQAVVPVNVPELPAPEYAYPSAGIETLEAEEQDIEVPMPSYTTTEAEKKSLNSELNFHGLNFKALSNQTKTDERDFDVQKVVTNLKDENFDKQALQMEEIAKMSAINSKNILPLINEEVFTSLINIVQKDTTELKPATAEQIDARKKIIVNELVKKQAKAENKDPKTIELPFKLTNDEIALAMELTPMELAERNKEYALYTIAMLAKAYTEETKLQTGNIVPLTDLPGISVIVDALRHQKNPGVRVAAIDALVYSNRPEYQEEIKSVLILAANEKNQMVANTAANALVQIAEKENN